MVFYIHPTMSSCLMLEFLPVRNRNFLWYVFAQNWTQLTLVLSFEHLNATSMQMNQYMNKQQLKCIMYLFTTVQLCNQCSLSICLHNTQLSKMSLLFITTHLVFLVRVFSLFKLIRTCSLKALKTVCSLGGLVGTQQKVIW